MITKVIKLHQDTYDKLESIRDKRESFDNVVRRLIMVYDLQERSYTIMGGRLLPKGPVPPPQPTGAPG
jgi:hypothetical protein